MAESISESLYDDVDLNDDTPEVLNTPEIPPEPKKAQNPQNSQIFKVKIAEFEKRGGFFDVHFVYRVETEVEGVAGYNRKRYDTWRRFTEFMDLHEKIVAKYRQKGVIIPQPPEKKMSVMAKAMDVIDKITIPIEETDQWFEKANSSWEELDENLRKLHAEAVGLVQHRKAMALNGEMLAKSLSSLAASEDSTTLSLALTSLTDTYEQSASIWSRQAEEHNAKFAEAVEEYLGLLESIRDVVAERIHVWQQWKKAQKTLEELRSKLSTVDDLKVKELNREIQETNEAKERLQKEFDEMSKAIKVEIERFEEERQEDMKHILVDFIQNMIQSHIQVSLRSFFDTKMAKNSQKTKTQFAKIRPPCLKWPKILNFALKIVIFRSQNFGTNLLRTPRRSSSNHCSFSGIGHCSS
ncbi:Protein CBG07900 [Caenorhabditis briggsae]|uniref:Protein CBG07900 n=1 Tax=Caenorhabditis briggsae TaxID=6238 RepID=A8X5D1_CAEBR|nr:Protein CBG07900 [Caenorhabditis briggsae]CAP27830.2 Protein CBG07900 [Caenorhabditis briggsae]